MVQKPYDHLWDCCCDHGYLGQSFLIERDKYSLGIVHLVDIVPALMNEVSVRLNVELSASETHGKWQVHCLDVAKLPITSTEYAKDASHLVIIAGVGGDLLVELIQAIEQNNRGCLIEFLLCPVHHNYKVRQALVTMGFGLVNEQLVEENKRFYEIIHVAKNSRAPLSLVGSDMWDLSRPADQRYLKETLAHYHRMKQNPAQQVNDVIDAYTELLSAEPSGF